MLYSDQAIKVDATSLRAPLACELGRYVLWFLPVCVSSSFPSYCWPGADDWRWCWLLPCIKHQVPLFFTTSFYIFLPVWLTTRVSSSSWCQRVNGKWMKWINRFLVGDASRHVSTKELADRFDALSGRRSFLIRDVSLFRSDERVRFKKKKTVT